MSLDFAGCYPGFPLHVSLIGNPFPNFHLLLAHSNHLQVLCHPPFPQSIVRILAISTLDVDATQRRCSPLSTTHRLRYSLHVSNSRLRPLIQHGCCYQDIFTRFPWAFRPINTPMVFPSFHNPAVKILAPRFQLTTSTIDKQRCCYQDIFIRSSWAFRLTHTSKSLLHFQDILGGSSTSMQQNCCS